MSSFTTPLETVELVTPHRNLWELTAPFSYYTKVPVRLREQLMEQLPRCSRFMEIVEERIWLHVPKGFITDFATIPRIFWKILPPYDPRYGKAAVIHDFLYYTGIGDRRWADDEFLECMKILGAHWPMRTTMYWAVRIFGRFLYLK